MFGKRHAFRKAAKKEAARVAPVIAAASDSVETMIDEIDLELRRLPELLCPKCQAAMIQKTARRGRYAGSQFWGCYRWPACDGLRQYRRQRLT